MTKHSFSRSSGLAAAAASAPINVMGFTFLEAGTSVPYFLSSLVVTKQRHRDMAVSSSIGSIRSNISDILVGIPFSWSNLLYDKFYYTFILNLNLFF